MDSLSGKRLLITGAANGIGAALSRMCGARGARAVLVDRDPAVEALAAELGAYAHVADVADPASAAAIVPAAAERLGGLDGLANVAGVHRKGDAAETPDEVWNEVLGVNLTAPFTWSRAALPILVAGG